MSGITGTQWETLYALPAQVTKNTYTTQAVFGPLAASAAVPKVPAYFFSESPNPLSRALYLQAMGTIATTSAATFAGALGLDTTAGTIANSITMFAATAPTASVTAQWNLDVWITCQAFGETAGMTWQVNGKWTQGSGATGAALNATAWYGAFSQNVTGLTPSTTYFLELFGTWSASAAGNTTTLQQMFLYGLN